MNKMATYAHFYQFSGIANCNDAVAVNIAVRADTGGLAPVTIDKLVKWNTSPKTGRKPGCSIRQIRIPS